MWYRVKWNSTSIKIALWWWTFLHARERKHKRNASSSYILNIYHHRAHRMVKEIRLVVVNVVVTVIRLDANKKREMLNGKRLYHCSPKLYPTLKYAHSFHFICLPVLFAVNSQYLWTNIQAIRLFSLSVSLLCTKSNMFHVNEDKMFDACPYASSSPKARQIERWVDRLVHLVFTSLIFSVRVNQKCFFNVVSYSISWFFWFWKNFN